MVYRNQHDADAARVEDLREELEEARRALAVTREELATLRRKYARALSVLSMIAHTQKVKAALEDTVTEPEQLAEMMASPSNRPPPLTHPPPAAVSTEGITPGRPDRAGRPRHTSAGRYLLVSEADGNAEPPVDSTEE